jgi:hypothetical protein
MRGQQSSVAKAFVAMTTAELAEGPARALKSATEAAGLDLVASGRLGAEGHRLVLRTTTGYCSIDVYVHDALAPLILARAGGFDPDQNAASCCMTEVDCSGGGGLKCLQAEDPCPGSKITDPWTGGQIGPLAPSEVRLIDALADLLGGLANQGGDEPTVREGVMRIRSAHEHRELLFASEDDGPGRWYDWILRLSNGMSVHVTLSTNPRRTAPVFAPAEFASIARERSSRISVVATDSGDRLVLPRLFVGD